MVKEAQDALRELGVDPGEVDGWMGPKTRAAITGAWWRVESKITAAEKELEAKLANAELRISAQSSHAQLVQQQLQEHKTYVAEHYVSKAGHRETMDTITGLIKDMGSDIRGLRDRLDKFMDGGNKKNPP